MTEFEHEYCAQRPSLVYATRWARLGAALLDLVIGLAVGIPLMWIFGVFDRVAEAMRNASPPALDLELAAMLLVLGWVAFFVLHGYLLYKYGQTIGKRLVGTKIVDPYGEVPSFGKLVVLRYLLPGVIRNVPVVGSLFTLANLLLIFRENHRCLHDDFAGTYVVNA